LGFVFDFWCGARRLLEKGTIRVGKGLKRQNLLVAIDKLDSLKIGCKKDFSMPVNNSSSVCNSENLFKWLFLNWSL